MMMSPGRAPPHRYWRAKKAGGRRYEYLPTCHDYSAPQFYCPDHRGKEHSPRYQGAVQVRAISRSPARASCCSPSSHKTTSTSFRSSSSLWHPLATTCPLSIATIRSAYSTVDSRCDIVEAKHRKNILRCRKPYLQNALYFTALSNRPAQLSRRKKGHDGEPRKLMPKKYQ